jgi:hypothetical protein
MPVESLSDQVRAAEVVAILRAAPDDPFRFAPVRILKGDAETPPVPFLVSRSRAAELAADPDGGVVGTWTRADGWVIHDYGGAGLALVLSDLLANDLSTPESQRGTFENLIDHPEPAVARMAMVELATLPYTVLRETDVRVSRHMVVDMLADPKWTEWAPIMIILFGMSDDPGDVAFLNRAMRIIAANSRTVHLAAWATALIEMEGAAGVAWLKTAYSDDPSRTEAELKAIGLALASHAQRTDQAGDAIHDALGDLAMRQPAIAGAMAQAMMEREDWSLAGTFRELLDDGRITAPADAFVITHYVLAAADAAAEQDFLQ